MEFWQKYKDLEKLIKRTTRDKKRALLEGFSRLVQEEDTERGKSLDPAVYNRHVQ